MEKRQQSGLLWWLWLRRHLTNCGPGVWMSGRPQIANNGELSIGGNTALLSDWQALRLSVGQGARLSIGSNCTINSAIIAANQDITIGDNVQIAPFAHLMDSDYHDLYDRSLPGPMAPIRIEDDVQIGPRAMILRGVTIGQGAVVEAGAVVNKSVPPGARVAGVPATVVEPATH